MSDNSARLKLPYIMPNQAQKHVTHNEAVEILDALTQLVLVDTDAETPPADPVPGTIHALGAAPTGDWDGQAGKLAYFSESGWLFLDPQPGWRAWSLSGNGLHAFDGQGWSAISGSTQNIEGLGIQSAWDATNRLSVAGEASLLSHAGGGHQLKINKAATADTASVLFQSDWTGHAEFGLAGERAFSIKISADGTTWQQAMRFDPEAGTIEADLPISGAAVQDAPDDIRPGRLMRADFGYGPGNLVGQVSQSGGAPSGAVIESGATSSGRYTRWADGTQICWANLTLGFDAANRLATDWAFPMPFATGSSPAVSASLASDDGGTPGPDALLAPLSRAGADPAHLGCQIRLYRVIGSDDFAADDGLPVSVVAIGRWF